MSQRGRLSNGHRRRIMVYVIDSQTLERITDLIVSTAAPRRIFLFGSHASGNADQQSDLDILVVVADATEDVRATASAIRIGISGLVESPVDVIVESESVFAERSELPTIERTILQTGVSLYAA